MIYIAHSFLEMEKQKIIFNKNSTVEDFRKSEINNQICLDIHKEVFEKYEYELSWNQLSNSIAWFIKSNKL